MFRRTTHHSPPTTNNVLLAEPERTSYDLHFRVFGIPVRVHPFFWLIALFTGAAPGTTPKQTFIWMGALFVSILIHELGHALAFLYFGQRPRITLHALGGLASADSGYSGSYEPYSDDSTRPATQIIISLAGPVAGFLFAGIIVGLIIASGAAVRFEVGGPYLLRWGFGNIASENLTDLLHSLIFVNIFWGLVNLLPIYPLDGGQISRELFLAANPSRGIEWSLTLSIVAAIAMAVYALFRFTTPFLTVLLFGYLAFASYQALIRYRNFGGRFGGYGRDRYDDDRYGDRGW
jgi:Zn-dependent protease